LNAVPHFFRQLSTTLDDMEAVIACGVLEPVQSLRSRIHLIVIFPFRKAGEFVQVIAEPRSALRQVNEAVLDRTRDRVHAHDLVVHRRFVLLDLVHALTD
jgi:hypothetical protein